MKTALAIAAAVLALSLPARSQDQDPAADPPSRAARLSFIGGTVSFQPGSVEDWVPATLNRPLTIADRLWTDADGRAELQIGAAEVRLNGRTNFSFLNLDDRTTQIQVSTGTLSIRVRHLDSDEIFEIDTPQLAFTILSAGEYRVDVDEAGNATIVTVRGGRAEFSAANQTHEVRAREQVRVTGIDQPVFDSRPAPPSDPFDNWCMERDRIEDRSVSARYVSRDVPGYADLDLYGSWSEVPEYGAIWIPSHVEVGWAPYHHGHWAWIHPWGWTWIDDAPWGYAPFHYGRWAFYGGSWGWVPGPRVVAVRPCYAPALVAWIGGSHMSVGISIGGAPHVGWFPLAPGEVFVPTYRPSSTYFNRVNVSNTVINRQVNITNVYNTTYVNNGVINNTVYRNRTINGAVTGVPAASMASGRRVSDVAVRLPQGAVDNAPVQSGAGVAPMRGSIVGGGDRAGTRPPVAVMDRPVVVRSAAPAPPVPFSRAQSAIEANQGRPLDPQTVRTMQQREPQPNRNLRQAGGDPGSRGGWRQTSPAGAPDAQPQVLQPRMERPSRTEDNRGFGRRPNDPQPPQVNAPPAPPPQVIQPRPQERPQDRTFERPSIQPRREERAPIDRPAVRPAEPAVIQAPRQERQIERPVARPAESPRPAPEVRQNRDDRREQRQEQRQEQRKEKEKP